MGAPNMVEESREMIPPPELGRNLSPMKEHDESLEHAEHEHGFEWLDIARIAFVALAAAAVGFGVWDPFPRISVFGVAATLIGGYPFSKRAIENPVKRKLP